MNRKMDCDIEVTLAEISSESLCMKVGDGYTGRHAYMSEISEASVFLSNQVL